MYSTLLWAIIVVFVGICLLFNKITHNDYKRRAEFGVGQRTERAILSTTQATSNAGEALEASLKSKQESEQRKLILERERKRSEELTETQERINKMPLDTMEVQTKSVSNPTLPTIYTPPSSKDISSIGVLDNDRRRR